MKYILFLFLFIPFTLPAQIGKSPTGLKDTVIIIPLGNSAMMSEALHTPLKTIDAGMYHCSLVDIHGKLTTWIDPRAYWIQAPQINDPVKQVATGDIHSVVLYTDSTINQYFLIPEINMFYPHKLSGVVEVRSGNSFSTALTKKGILYAWGPGKSVTNLGIPLKTYGVKQTSVGKNHIAFINIKNKVFVWGDHSFGQNNKPECKAKPVQIAPGDYHCIVLDELKQIYVWGNNSYGQCLIPSYSGNVTHVAAKHSYTLLQLDNQKIIAWGMGKTVEQDFSGLGKIKMSTLGYDFIAVVVEATAEKITEWYLKRNSTSLATITLQDSSRFTADSLMKVPAPMNADNFIQSALKEDFHYTDENGNVLSIQSINSRLTDENSSTIIEFDGSNNHLTIINDSVHTHRRNSTQRIIVKGSNHSRTIRIQNQTGDITNEHSTVVIDLDRIGTENSYPDVYADAGEPAYTADQIIDLESLPTSSINDWIIEKGIYYANGEIMGYINDRNEIWENVILTHDPFVMAQMHFIYKEYEEGMQILKKAADYPEWHNCRMALFEIYYYGFFNQPISLSKAKYYYFLNP